ncbi:uncharacterized protein LOC6544651 [Drosophila erecta]|uniref:Uncharacterized protein n=1 Tax=Drosophila erecta TaxID=7220 RepID=B3NEH7_DROER|nr:uncharacterized protein LOC6544651 [Drosophila erecta]EDV52812.1 uncharacterized protein Dere_GG13162 [Drosophila erecta]
MGSKNNEDQNVAVSGRTISSSPELFEEERLYAELDSEGRMVSRTMTLYECQLEGEVEQLQEALFKISSHYAKVQFRLRQISLASGCERDNLLKDLERLTAKGLDATGPIWDEKFSMPAKLRVKQDKILCQLRGSLGDLVKTTGVCFHANHYPATNRSLRISTDASNKAPRSKVLGQGCGRIGKCIGHAKEESKPATGYMEGTCCDIEYRKLDTHFLQPKSTT